MNWRKLARVLICGLALDCSALPAFANFTATQGSGITIGSGVIGGVHYQELLLCDPTAGSTQCVGVNASNQLAIQAPPSLPLPTSAATSALQTTGNTALTTINTTLGSPFQAGGSIGNTSFAVTQGTAANLNATVVQGTAANLNATVVGTVTANAGTNLNTSALATSANQTNASQKTQIVDGSGNVIASTSNNLNVQCANCSGSGVSAADAATFTAGTSLMAPIGAQFTSGGATACVTGHECTLGMTAARQLFTDTSTIAGTTVLTGNGTAGAGAQRVTIASDNTAFSVNATLQASGTTAIGKVDPNTIATWGLATVGAGTAPTNAMVAGCIQASPTPSANQSVAVSCDANGNVKVVGTGLAQGSTTSGQTGSMVMGAVTTGSPTYTTAQTSPLSLDTSGNLRVNVVAGGGSGGTSSSFGSAFPGTGTAIGLTNGTNMVAWSATSNYGTAPSAIAVPAVNASVTNTVAMNQSQYGGTAVAANPCLTGTLTYIPVSQTANAQVASLGGSSKKNYICAINIVGADAENISIVEGTGTVCATTTAAIIGGTTAANGWNFAANGGIAQGNGAAPIAAGSLTSLNNVCVFQSGTGRVSGSIVLAQQ